MNTRLDTDVQHVSEESLPAVVDKLNEVIDRLNEVKDDTDVVEPSYTPMSLVDTLTPQSSYPDMIDTINKILEYLQAKEEDN